MLAALIKAAARDTCKDKFSKGEYVNIIIDKNDKSRHGIEITDDSGLRSLIIGDNATSKYRYVSFYTERCSYEDGKPVWQYRCFPPIDKMVEMLEILYNKEYRPDIIEYHCYDNDYSACVTYLSELVRKYADAVSDSTHASTVLLTSF